MAIEIRAEKVLALDKSGPCYLVREVRCLGRDKLPKEYKDSLPWCCLTYYDGQQCIEFDVSGPGYHKGRLTVGKTYDQEDFEKVLEIIRRCGQRLRKINEKRKELTIESQGEVTFLI